jgi:hypothetical protein
LPLQQSCATTANPRAACFQKEAKMQGLRQEFIRGLDRWGSVIAAAGVALFAATVTQYAVAQATGIAATKHNLSSGAPAGQNRVTVGTDEICVFCHTPHGADTAAAAPLWNKSLGSLGTPAYTTYSSTTMDGAFATDGPGSGSVGSVSLACLSCHDGTQAMDNIINAPGSGGYDATGGGANGRAYTWDTSTGRVNADGKLLNGGGYIANLSSDLSNDHPIGIQYCGGGQSTTATGGACVDKDFKAPNTRLIGTQQVWWVDTSITGSTTNREKSDMILYTRNFGTTTGPSVECASCHDPHVDSASTPGAGATFLRVSNTGSAVCLSCHVK